MTRHFLSCSSAWLLLATLSSSNAFSTPPSRTALVGAAATIAASRQQQPFQQSRVILQYQANDTAVDDFNANDMEQLSSLIQKQEQVVQDDDDPAMMAVVVEEKEQGGLMALFNKATSITKSGDGTEDEPMSDVVKARILLLGAAALYGTNFSLVKLLGEQGLSVGLSSTLRFGMAALVTLPWLLKVDPEDAHQRWETLIMDPNSKERQAALGGLEVGMWNSIGYVAQAVGLETTSASKSAFLCSLAVVVVPFLDYLVGKKLEKSQLLGASLAVLGVAFLELEGMTGGALSGAAGHLEPGDIASFVQPIAFGLGFWRMEAAMKKQPEEAERATAAQLMAVFLGSATYMAAMSVVDPATIPSQPQLIEWVTDPAILGALFWTGVVTTALTIYMETIALKTLSAAETTLIFSTEPIWGTAFATVVMGETMGVNAAVGAVMILSGCVVSNLDFKSMSMPSFITNLMPGQQQKDKALLSSNEADRMEWDDNFPTSYPDYNTNSNPNRLPQQPMGKFGLKSGVAGALTGVVAAMEGASSSTGVPNIEPEDLQDVIDVIDTITHLSQQ